MNKLILSMMTLLFLGQTTDAGAQPPAPLPVGMELQSSRHAAVANPPEPATATISRIFQTVTPAQANELIHNRQDLLVLDIRNPNELEEGYIEGSSLLPIWNIIKGRYDLPENQPILVVCAVGGRSYAVGQYFSRKGYPEIYNLKGGIAAWKEAGLPVTH